MSKELEDLKKMIRPEVHCEDCNNYKKGIFVYCAKAPIVKIGNFHCRLSFDKMRDNNGPCGGNGSLYEEKRFSHADLICIKVYCAVIFIGSVLALISIVI